MLKILRLAIVCATFLLVSSTAMAQFVAPIKYNEGPGIKLTDSLVFHPGLAIEGRYDSNALYTNTSNPNEAVHGAPYLRLIGHLHLATLPPQRLTDGDGKVSLPKVAFRLKGAVTYREYFSNENKVTDKRAVEADVGISLRLFPYGSFSVEIFDDYARTVPSWSGPNAYRNTNRAGARFKIKPGGGRLTFNVDYSFNIDIFDTDNFAWTAKTFHEIKLVAKWRLLPKTAVFFEASEQIYGYLDPLGGRDAIKCTNSNETVPNSDSYPLRMYLGFAGLITPRFSVLAKVGYGNGFYDADESYNMMLGQAELTWFLSPLAKIRIGFEHGFNDAFYANYFVDEKAYLGYDHFIINRILLHMKVEYRYRQHEGFPEKCTSVKELNYHMLKGDLGLDYKIFEWFYVGVGYNLELREQTSPALPRSGGTYYNDFVKHQVFGKVGLSY